MKYGVSSTALCWRLLPLSHVKSPTANGSLGASGVGAAAGSGGGSTVAAVDQWVESHGNAVPASAYGGTSSGTLYEVTKTSVD